MRTGVGVCAACVCAYVSALEISDYGASVSCTRIGVFGITHGSVVIMSAVRKRSRGVGPGPEWTSSTNERT